MENEYYKRYEPFFGEWRIKRFIGAGSYGRVFEIERRDEFDTVYTGALKAVTIPSSQGELDEILADGMDMNGASTYFRDYVKELNREIALMSKLKGHSNIVSYEDHKMFPHEDGVGWDILIRMELLTPITSYLKQNHTFTRREVIQLGMDLCKALEICQRYNIIHRDIKPANIFISETEDFKLGDFGVARIASASTGASTRAGTVNYMAPEVFRGEKYTSNVDIYSLGLVMYQLLNNNRMPLYPPYPQPITPSSRERAQAQRLSGAALPPPANADGRLAEIVLKACAPDPAQRYDSPTVMRQALEAILYTEGEAKMIYPEGDTVPVPSTSGAAAPEENDPNGETERPVWGKAHADSEKPAKAEKTLPECLKNARDDAPLEHLRHPVTEGALVLIAVLVGVQQLLQIVHDGPHQGGDLLLLVSGQEADVVVELGVGTADDDAPVLPVGVVVHLLQPHRQGVEGLGGARHALDDHQRRLVRPGHQGRILQVALPHGAPPFPANAQTGRFCLLYAAKQPLYALCKR